MTTKIYQCRFAKEMKDLPTFDLIFISLAKKIAPMSSLYDYSFINEILIFFNARPN